MYTSVGEISSQLSGALKKAGKKRGTMTIQRLRQIARRSRIEDALIQNINKFASEAYGLVIVRSGWNTVVVARTDTTNMLFDDGPDETDD